MNHAMNMSRLSILSYAKGFTLWHYRVEALEDPTHAGFFNDAMNVMAPGDAILATGPGFGRTLVVSEISPAGVSVTRMPA